MSARYGQESLHLSEDLWKKFDNLIGIIQNLNEDYFVDNKIIIRLENYLLAYLECEDEKHQVDSFDFAISRTVLNDMLLEGNPNTFINQNDLFAYLETNFEGRDLYEFEAVIKSYYMLYDTEGNRHYE